ncbi:MAG: hypothetical protein IIB81_00715, partial [Nanoarchaeota archaeon]|nr:hypothetical protein [Nanoarchaeota archaeon]
MISKKDIQEDIQWVNEFRNNAARAMGLRMRLVREKLNAIHLLEQDLQSKEGLALLKRALKNERRFNRIIEKGLAESFGKLKEIYDWMRKNVRDKEAKNNTKKLVELVGYFYLKSKNIDKRLQLEEAFLESKGLKSDRRRIAIAKQNIDELRRLTESKALTLQDPIQLLVARDKLIKPILEVFESLPGHLQAEVRKLNLWFAKNVIPPDTFKRGLNKWVDDFNNTKDRITQLGINMANSMSRGFDDFFFHTIT